MGIFDKAKDMVGEHNDKVDQAIDKGADVVNQRTGDQHSEHIDQGADQVKQHLDQMSDEPPAQR
jgi:phage shock protein A